MSKRTLFIMSLLLIGLLHTACSGSSPAEIDAQAERVAAPLIATYKAGPATATLPPPTATRTRTPSPTATRTSRATSTKSPTVQPPTATLARLTPTLQSGGAIVPDVTGLTAAEAQQQLTAAGFQSFYVDVTDLTRPDGEIFKQEPEAGTAVDPATIKVKLYRAVHAAAPAAPPAGGGGSLPGGARVVSCSPNGGPVYVENVRAWYIERYTQFTKQTIPQTGLATMKDNEQAVYYRADDPNDGTLYVFCKGVNWPGP